MLEFDSEWFNAKLHDLKKSQADLSRSLGIDRATAHNLLKGNRKVQLADIEPLANFYNVSEIEILQRSGVQFSHVAGVENIADKNQTSIVEINMDAAGGSSENAISDASNLAVWRFPEKYLSAEMKVDTENSRILEVKSDNMAPTLNRGDRIMVNFDMRSPSPAGVFLVWDGLSATPHRIEPVIGSVPLQLSIKSDATGREDRSDAADITILGRVVWVCKMM